MSRYAALLLCSSDNVTSNMELIGAQNQVLRVFHATSAGHGRQLSTTSAPARLPAMVAAVGAAGQGSASLPAPGAAGAQEPAASFRAALAAKDDLVLQLERELSGSRQQVRYLSGRSAAALCSCAAYEYAPFTKNGFVAYSLHAFAFSHILLVVTD